MSVKGLNKMLIMTTQQLHAMLRAAPFQPFDVYLANGKAIPVRHPELVLVTPGGRTIVIASEDDAVEIVDLLLVTSLKARTNGAAR
jgi:hypothetical protein